MSRAQLPAATEAAEGGASKAARRGYLAIFRSSAAFHDARYTSPRQAPARHPRHAGGHRPRLGLTRQPQCVRQHLAAFLAKFRGPPPTAREAAIRSSATSAPAEALRQVWTQRDAVLADTRRRWPPLRSRLRLQHRLRRAGRDERAQARSKCGGACGVQRRRQPGSVPRRQPVAATSIQRSSSSWTGSSTFTFARRTLPTTWASTRATARASRSARAARTPDMAQAERRLPGCPVNADEAYGPACDSSSAIAIEMLNRGWRAASPERAHRNRPERLPTGRDKDKESTIQAVTSRVPCWMTWSASTAARLAAPVVRAAPPHTAEQNCHRGAEHRCVMRMREGLREAGEQHAQQIVGRGAAQKSSNSHARCSRSKGAGPAARWAWAHLPRRCR